MITSVQMKAARALLGMDQLALAKASGVSLPTIRRMEASQENVRANVDTLVKVIKALENAGVEFIGEGTASLKGGSGVRWSSQ